jgi:hypothetical protein
VADFTVALKEEMERGMERFGGKNQKMLCGRKWLSSLDFNTVFQNREMIGCTLIHSYLTLVYVNQ